MPLYDDLVPVEYWECEICGIKGMACDWLPNMCTACRSWSYRVIIRLERLKKMIVSANLHRHFVVMWREGD